MVLLIGVGLLTDGFGLGTDSHSLTELLEGKERCGGFRAGLKWAHLPDELDELARPPPVSLTS